jgi:predicted nucleic acid-binding protein
MQKRFVDDYDARVVARENGLKVTGAIGLLLRAKYAGKIGSLRNELDRLKESGFWLNEDLYQ